jgi:hypothetical protein
LYGYSTKLDAEKYGYDGLARIIYAASEMRVIRFYPPDPPNSWSILRLQKNGTDAEAVQNAVQLSVQMNLQNFVQKLLQQISSNMIAV